MDKNALWKWLILIVLVIGSFWLIYPPKDKIRLGLDLQGGTSFTVEIDEEGVAKQMREENPEITDAQIADKMPAFKAKAIERSVEVIRTRVDGLGIAEPVIYPEKGKRIVVQLPGIDEAKREEATKAIKSAAFLEFRMVHEKNEELTAQLFEQTAAPDGYKIVELAGKRDEQTFYERDKTAVPDTALDKAFREKLKKFRAPPGYDFMLERVKIDNRTVYRPFFVSVRRELTGDMLRSASVDYRALGQPVVNLQFKSQGGKKFARVTAEYAPGGSKNPNPQNRRYMAIILDEVLHSAPYIKESIPNGRAEISGSFTPAEANFLSNILRAGSLPAPVEIVNQVTVDPTLGKDSRDSGISAGLYGCAAILVLMACYYLYNGLIANLALVLNVWLLPLGMVMVAGFLGIFSTEARGGAAIALPVLTLPGIAGIALSIGMAVDANVLILERMREELATGKGFSAAIQAGYTRAFTAIFDSNITTLITAVILFLLGSGPVRGYAVTLAAGLIVSLYSAVVVTRMFYNWMAAKNTDVKVLRMFAILKATSIDFISKWKIALTMSVAVIAVTWGLMVSHGLKDQTSVFGVDFTGGSSVTLSFDQEQPVESLRSALSAGGLRDVTIQYQKKLAGGKNDLLQIKVGSMEEGAKVKGILSDKFPAAGFKVMAQDDVGPQIGRELKTKAMWAMLTSLIAMIIYISWRFEFGFALGAVVALFHDVLITAGLCHVLGFQINMTIVAALMTIVGYSVNDTIVIFDRIREDLRLVRNKTFLEICNQSMNETLARTILTNFLTFVSVLCLVVFGGGAIKDFSVAMLIGMFAGTYSTIYIATPIVLLWYRFKLPEMGSKVVVSAK